MVVAATLSVAATDHFFIEDFNISAGQTVPVSILLENESRFTAFQTDLYLPEGLTVAQDQFTLNPARRAPDHTIACCYQPDGALRIMSYSMSIAPYSGSEGALVTFNVTADDQFSGPAVIALRNTYFTLVTGVEMELEDSFCTVNPLKLGDVNGDGNLTVGDVAFFIGFLLNGSSTAFCVDNADVNEDQNVNVADVAQLIKQLLAQ